MMSATNTRVSEELSLVNVTSYRLTGPEDEGTVIIRNASEYLTVGRRYHPKRLQYSVHRTFKIDVTS
jgi:hypothetical protein